MKVWQGCLLAFGAFIVLVGAIIAIVFYATSGITQTADDFFAAANDGDYEQAYSLTSQQLQGQTDVAGLEAYLADNGLNEVVDTSWASRSINNNRGELSGTLTTRSGGEIPVEIELISEGEEWKIVFINVDNAGLQSSGGGGTASAAPEPMVVPSESEQESLLFFATAGFVNALSDGDYESWQNRFVDDITAADLKENFSSFEPMEPGLRRIIMGGPDFEPATELNDAGQLELTGTYGSGGEVLRFRYIFTGEGDDDPKISFVDYELN